MVNVHAKFDEDGHNGLVSVLQSQNVTHQCTDGTTEVLLYVLHKALLGNN